MARNRSLQNTYINQISERSLRMYKVFFSGAALLFLGFLFLPGTKILPGISLFLMLVSFFKTRNELKRRNLLERKMTALQITGEPEEKPLPALPKTVRKKKNVPSAYSERLGQLHQFIQEMKEREAGVEEFLDDFFGQSEISKARYLKVMKDAEILVENNYKKACQAVKVFGTAKEPSAERLQILDTYIEDSRDVLKKVEIVVDQLILTDQSGTLKSGDPLDESLDELARTTSYYQKQM